MAARSALSIWAILLSLSASLTQGFNVGSLTKRVGHHPSPLAVGPSSASVASRLSSTSTKEDEGSDIDPVIKAELRSIANHLAKQTLEATLSQSDATAISNELLFDSESKSSIFNDNTYQQYVKYWAKVEARLREENQRTPADLLGRELTDRILASIRGDAEGGKKGRSSGSYDAQTVRAFLDSDAVNALFTQLLCETTRHCLINPTQLC